MPLSSSGYDGGRKVPGRKRHIVTDRLGLLLVVAVTAAKVGDRDAAVPLLQRLHTLRRDGTLTVTGEAIIPWSMITRMGRRLARPRTRGEG
ncbi:transposase (plasmid) [Streptomyces sp. NBC_00184]|uniref:transposase n=1 Tax=Streptomyces sp. NBC_00184 TaxID=2975673 RepID=UPI002E28146B|nr:transposase [Streptomyces sp. NBC_00184]